MRRCLLNLDVRRSARFLVASGPMLVYSGSLSARPLEREQYGGGEGGNRTVVSSGSFGKKELASRSSSKECERTNPL